jgi:hypothetical protein
MKTFIDIRFIQPCKQNILGEQTNMSCLFADCISHGVYHNITNKQKNLTPSADNEMWDKFRTIDLRAL